MVCSSVSTLSTTDLLFYIFRCIVTTLQPAAATARAFDTASRSLRQGMRLTGLPPQGVDLSPYISVRKLIICRGFTKPGLLGTLKGKFLQEVMLDDVHLRTRKDGAPLRFLYELRHCRGIESLTVLAEGMPDDLAPMLASGYWTRLRRLSCAHYSICNEPTDVTGIIEALSQVGASCLEELILRHVRLCR